MDNNPVETKTVKSRTAHSNFRKGLSDYNDGENVTHYLGNNDYAGSKLPDPNDLNQNNFDGKEAAGNDFLEDEDQP